MRSQQVAEKVCVSEWMCVRVSVCLCIYVWEHENVGNLCVCVLCAHACLCAHVCICVCLCMHVCAHLGCDISGTKGSQNSLGLRTRGEIWSPWESLSNGISPSNHRQELWLPDNDPAFALSTLIFALSLLVRGAGAQVPASPLPLISPVRTPPSKQPDDVGVKLPYPRVTCSCLQNERWTEPSFTDNLACARLCDSWPVATCPHHLP